MSNIVTIEADVARMGRQWDELAERCGATPFHHLGWIQAWRSAFGSGGLMLVTLRRSDDLVAALPLEMARGRLSSPTNWHTPVFGPLAEDPQSARELLDYVFSLERRSIDLSLLDVDDGSFGLVMEAAERAGRLVAARPLVRSPSVTLDGDWEHYQRRLSANRRRSVQRCMRRLEEHGDVTLAIERGESGLERLLEDAFRLEASGWKGSRGTAIASRPETRRFYSDVAGWAAGRGWLRLAFLRVGGRPVAFDLSLEKRAVRYSLKSGFDAAHARYGPGAVLLYELLREAYASGVERFELLGPEDDFKRGWADSSSERSWLHACAPSPAGRAEATIVRTRERIRPLARRVRAWAGS